MKLAIMQPYFLPYIGYFQLINEVDQFIIYDDVNFIKGGWINRNRILLDGQPTYLNMPMSGASSFKKINEINVGEDLNLVLNKIRNSYSKAPYFDSVFPIISDLIKFDCTSLSLNLANAIINLSKLFELDTEFVLSSDIKKDNDLKGQEKVISICKIQNSNCYYNSIGGVSLYSKKDFASNGIDLGFIKPQNIEYNQFRNQFVPNLSILDMMMFNDLNVIKENIKMYDLV